MQRALELYARIGMGQLSDLEQHHAFMTRDYDYRKVRDLFDSIKSEVFTDLYRGQYYGIRHEGTHESSKEAYDIYQVIRHKLAWHRNPEGNNWNVMFDDPVRFSSQPFPDIEIKE